MNRFIRQRLGNFPKWPLALIAILIWGYFITRLIYGTGFLAGLWGIKNDEIAVVTIKQKNDQAGSSSIEEITIIDPGISLWDGLSVLGIPIVLFILGAWLQQSQQKQATDEAREEVLQVYFDRISALLVDKNLMAISAKDRLNSSVTATDANLIGVTPKEHRTAEQQELLDASLDIIRARTLSILRRFAKDIERKSSIIRFLAEAEIISKLKLDTSRFDLAEADLIGVPLIKANLTGAILNRAKLQKAYLLAANLSKANLKEANLTGADFEVANLEEANLVRANLFKVSLLVANLTKADLKRANLKEAYLEGTNFSQANLNGANLKGADLNHANLLNAKLEGANLQWTILAETNLEGANLVRANLKGSKRIISSWPDFKGPNLKRANLEKANLKGANLERANLEGANLNDIRFDSKTVWPQTDEIAKAKNIPNKLKKSLGL